MATTAVLGTPEPIRDEHSVLLWQACAYADDLTDAARSGRRLIPAYDAMLEFLHYRLLPYLGDEERRLPPARFRDRRMQRLLVSDHERLRADADNVESSRTRRLLPLAAATLVDRLDRHARREECWLADPDGDPMRADVAERSLPLVFGDVVDLDALPPDHRDALVRQRLARLRRGESLRLEASTDLHRLWQREHHAVRDAYVWVYDEDGPVRWRARITRRSDEDG